MASRSQPRVRKVPKPRMLGVIKKKTPKISTRTPRPKFVSN